MDSLALTRRQLLQTSVLGGSTLYLTSCTTGELTQGVRGVVVAANLVLGILEAAGVVPAFLVTLVSPYLANVSQAIVDTTTETQSPDPAASKAAKIANIWAALVSGVPLPGSCSSSPHPDPCVPDILLTDLALVVAAIKALLAIVNAGNVQLRRLGTTASTTQFQLTRGDRRALGQLTKEAMGIKTRALALK